MNNSVELAVEAIFEYGSLPEIPLFVNVRSEPPKPSEEVAKGLEIAEPPLERVRLD